MRERDNFIEPLLEQAEQYSRTSIELFKLRTVDKTAGSGAILFSRFLLILTLSVFAVTINIAVALWLGNILGRNYYGFLVVAVCYAILSVILAILHPVIKSRVKNSIITQLLK